MSEWQPIETAPKYEKINIKKYDVEYYGLEWFEGAWCKVYCDQAGPYPVFRVNNPTHWMPLPTPPKEI